MSDVPSPPTGEVAPAARSGGPRVRFVVAVAALALASVVAASTRLHVTGHAWGLFLLAPATGSSSRFELTDDLFLGEGSRIVAGVSHPVIRRLLRGAVPLEPGTPSLALDWDEADGRGAVRNLLADGREVVTFFSRYGDDLGTPHGLFVGGSLPDVAAEASRQNESGMSIREERGWRHVWCNVNEAILDPRKGLIDPPAWEFLGSRVLIRGRTKVVIESSHSLEIDGEPVLIDRHAYFRAGRPWFRLGIHILNAGDAPIRFSYVYGDEPWVGNFGSGESNVGWLEERIVLTEGPVDTSTHHWAGILDVREKMANFVYWSGRDLPTDVFFSNGGRLSDASGGEPLSSNEVLIELHWRDRVLEPGESMSILLTLGIADMDAATGRPKLPLLARDR